MIRRIVKLSFHIEKVEEIHRFLKGKVDSIRAVDGCEYLEIVQDRKNKGLIFTLSHWQSEDHLNAYRKSEVFGGVWPILKASFNAPPEAYSTDQIL